VSPEPPDPLADLMPKHLEGLTITFEEWSQDPSLLEKDKLILLLERASCSIQEIKAKVNFFCSRNRHSPIVFKTSSSLCDLETFQLQLAGELGSLLVDGILDGVWVENTSFPNSVLNETVLMILQAAGARISKTEYIACPSCGRTHFDILSRLKEIRQATSHLTTLKIGVMGCIVNGPGEMADADYGYVGAGPGKVSIYKGKKAMLQNIAEEESLEALIAIMKKEGDWIDP
jgi:(E)-4-hydroxy-3-methylbut-2-enyl-diphosphate synthase